MEIGNSGLNDARAGLGRGFLEFKITTYGECAGDADLESTHRQSKQRRRRSARTHRQIAAVDIVNRDISRIGAEIRAGVIELDPNGRSARVSKAAAA